jgi:hypothetical protein
VNADAAEIIAGMLEDWKLPGARDGPRVMIDMEGYERWARRGGVEPRDNSIRIHFTFEGEPARKPSRPTASPCRRRRRT